LVGLTGVVFLELSSYVEVELGNRLFVALCLRIVIAITNYERGNDPEREKLKL